MLVALAASTGCAPLVGLDEDFYVRAGGGGSGSASGGSDAGGAGAATGGSGATASDLQLPPGKLAYHSYTDYSNGDAEMFLVEFPQATQKEELGELFQVCGPLGPSFSPDGQWLAVSARPWSDPCPTGDAKRDDLEIFLLDLRTMATTPNKIRVTQNTVPDEDPQYSADGAFLIVKHAGDVAKFVLNALETPHTTCDALPPGSYCFTTAEEEIKPVISSENVVFFQQGNDADADIYSFRLDEAQAAGNFVPANVSAREGLYEARLSIADNWLYYARWRSLDNKVDQVARKSLAKLEESDELATFAEDPANDYTDPFGAGGDLVLFALDAGVGKHDLYIGDFSDSKGRAQNLDSLGVKVNTDNDELSPVYWRAPTP